MTKKKDTAIPRKRGRPALYRSEYAEQAERLCLLGMIDDELAKFFGVSPGTIDHWKRDHADFLCAVRRGRDVADAKVAEKLYRRAMGYEHEAVKIFMPAGASEPVYAAYTEHYPPDTNAASLWLRNRQPKKWRDRQELTGENGAPLMPVLNVTISRDKP